MKSGILKKARHSTALMAFMFGASAAQADPAALLGKTICDNQADSFDYQWITANVADVDLFFLSGDTVENGTINAVGHEEDFNDADDVYIALHGAVDVVGDFSGADFAALFLANHASTPTSVTFYVCQSGTPPEGGVSSMAALARSYPGEVEHSTLIGAVNAPGPNTCPALAVDADAEPFDPIDALGQAVYHTDIDHTDDFDERLAYLMDRWDGGGVTYPDTEQTYEDYCEAQLANDPTGQWVSGFIANVNAQFGAAYLSLVNANYGGDDLVTCGPDVQCD
ncbi:hypothetical protein [Kordiimonas sp.]|uniref:hypothetical protein n=1 Tax=Kordiimonas sp. TaxID=1970157 RepID=UPI003A913961